MLEIVLPLHGSAGLHAAVARHKIMLFLRDQAKRIGDHQAYRVRDIARGNSAMMTQHGPGSVGGSIQFLTYRLSELEKGRLVRRVDENKLFKEDGFIDRRRLKSPQAYWKITLRGLRET